MSQASSGGMQGLPLRLLVAAVSAVLAATVVPQLAARSPDMPFVPASPRLLAECRATARTVGYAVPCPTRVPVGLVPSGGRAGCAIEIIGPARPCPNTAFLWRGWVIGSSVTVDAQFTTTEHLVLTASPRPLSDYAKVVNGPAWYVGARVQPLGRVTINGWRMREVLVPPASNDGSAFAGHVVLIWTVGRHTYGIGFHDLHGTRSTLALDLALARGIRLVGP